MLELSHGNSYTITYNVTNLDGTPKDLSGTQALKYELSKRDTSDPLIQYTMDSSTLNITDNINGVIVLNLTSDVLNKLSEGTHYHEIWHVNALGDPNTLMSSKLKIVNKLIKEQ